MSKQVLKLHQTDSKFLESAATKVLVNGEEWYYLPFWYHKAADGIFVEYPFEDLPDSIKNFIRTEREPNPQQP